MFFLSLEDPLFKQYGAEKEAAAIRARARAPYRKIRSRRIRSFVKKAQKKAEGVRYMERKSVREYDQVLNVQRDLIYEERDRILERTDMDRFLTGIFKRTAGYAARSLGRGRRDYRRVYREFSQLVPVPYGSEALKGLSRRRLEKVFFQDLLEAFHRLCQEAYPEPSRRAGMIRRTALFVIDACWTRHLDALAQLKQGAALQAYGQTDPKNRYAIHAYDMFDEMLAVDTVQIAQLVLKNACFSK